jgi:NADH:ubiquinone oxidoreductase subunit 5 (subunit L)/multisubunit Na+/H+ antiporter MnhA subunit
MLGAGLTSLYTFRLIFRVFFGPLGTPVTKRPGYAMKVPLVILAVFAIAGGYLKGPLLAFVLKLFRCLAHGVDDLVVRLGVIQLGLQKQRSGVEFLGSCHIGLGAESLSMQ